MIITLQLSMSVAKIEEKILGVSMRLNQAMRQRFQNIIVRSFKLGSYFKTGSSFAGLTWLLTSISGGKDFIPDLKYVEPRDLLDVFPQSIVISCIHY